MTDWNRSLQNCLAGATRLRVRSGGTCHRNVSKEKTLLDLSDSRQIQDVIDGIRIDEAESGFECMCCGEPSLEFYKGNALTALLGFHHGLSLRWDKGAWPGDGKLEQSSSGFLIQWLAEHGVTGPRDEMEASLTTEKEILAASERWTAAVPQVLRPAWEQAMFNEWNAAETLRPALYEAFPEKSPRILALLKWFGSGAGPWSGFPSYEIVVERLLVEHTTQAILQALQNVELSEPLIEGVARYFGGWDFSQKHPNDLKLLPPELKKRLLEHSLKTDSEDKRQRARKAFGR